jgi:cytochrome c553
MKLISIFGLSALLFTAAACDKKEAAPSASGTGAPAASAAAAGGDTATPDDAKKYYASKCVVCHGESGKGDGPGAGALNPKPRDLTAADWQGATKDEDIKKVLLSGGAAVGKSPIMPGNPDLKGKEALQNELVKLIRGFKG